MNHDHLVLIAELSGVNQDIARYIGRVLDLDRGRTEFTTPLSDVESALAARLRAVGHALHMHAAERRNVANLPDSSRTMSLGGGTA